MSVVVFMHAKVFMHSCGFYQKSILYLLASLKKILKAGAVKADNSIILPQAISKLTGYIIGY